MLQRSRCTSHTYTTAGTFAVTAMGVTGSSTKTNDITISKVPTATAPQNLLVCEANNDGYFNGGVIPRETNYGSHKKLGD